MDIMSIDSTSSNELRNKLTKIILGDLSEVYKDEKTDFLKEEILGEKSTKVCKAIVDFELINTIDVNPGESKKDIFQKCISGLKIGEMKINDCAKSERGFSR